MFECQEMIHNPPGMTFLSDQHFFSPNNTNAELRGKVMRINNDHQRGNALIFYQILFINLRKCMEIGLENFYVENLYELLLYWGSFLCTCIVVLLW